MVLLGVLKSSHQWPHPAELSPLGRRAVAEDCGCPQEGLGELVGSTAIRLLRVEGEPLTPSTSHQNGETPVTQSLFLLIRNN